MKKFFALIAVFAMVASICAYAAPTVPDAEVYEGEFSSIDYTYGFDTIPAFYTGTLKYEGKFSAPETCKVVNAKGSMPVYMALCIPCLKCFYNCALVDGTDETSGCEDLNEERATEPMTGYLYFVTAVDKKEKTVTYVEHELDGSFGFFNYGASSKDKQVALLVGVDTPEWLPIFMVGEKDSKKWSLCDASNDGKKTSVAVTMPKSFTGYAFFIVQGEGNSYAFTIEECTTAGFFGNATISFKRDDAKTKKIMSWMCGVEEECFYTEGSECEDVIGGAFDELILNKSYSDAKGWTHVSGHAFLPQYDVSDEGI